MMESNVSWGVDLTGLSKTYGGDVPAVQDVVLQVRKGSFVSLLGPSGCGKTTTLRMIAGLETPDTGEIRIGGELVFSARQRIDVPPAKRKIGFVSQSYALWPHMTVAENLAYPLKRAGLDAAAANTQVETTLAMLKASHLKKRYPGELSGGQQQRIALGRAVINADNNIVLFDEPLSNLDAKLREDLRMEIRALQEDLGFTAIYVTHDQAEAMSMSDHIVIMRDGRIEREGTPEEVFHNPRSRYVAEFFGAHNIVSGTVRSVDQGAYVLDTPLGLLSGTSKAAVPPVAGARVDATVPVESVRLSAERVSSADFEARVVGVAYYGNHSDVGIEVGGLRLLCRVAGHLRFNRGETVFGQTTTGALILES